MVDLPSKEDILRAAGPHRASWGPPPAGLQRATPGPGQESVWDFPRPPLVRPAPARIRVEWRGVTLAETDRALEVCETAGAPVPYIPPEDVATEHLQATDDYSICEWKGAAVYYDLVGPGGARVRHGAFTYPDPLTDLTEGYGQIAGWFGFYVGRVDACWLGDERVQPQPGGLYAGWVTSRLVGPIKGGPGSQGW